ncbi:follistatin-related protein 5-like, partial [Xenia sp. Carnegie-2017]|uniref:follistatin-related protein 5-like n=1 Tax=Xenia sp. Carnegie-2017 TaxID=2897299 RepID=UPI001F03324E
VDGSVYVLDASGNAVHVINVTTRQVIESIKTDPQPHGLYYLPWRKEVWVHSWNLSTFDVIKTDTRNRSHRAIRAHISPGWTHGQMIADKALLKGQRGYVTHFSNPGIHKLNLEGKSYAGFVNLSTHGCTGTFRIAYNFYNQRVYVDCRYRYRSVSTLEINPSNDTVTRTFRFPGYSFASPNGRFLVTTYRRGNISRMNILFFSGSDFQHHPQLLIPGGVSRAVFYPKKTNPDTYYVFVTLDYINKMAVVDLELAGRNDSSRWKYIDDVDRLETRRHGASRKLFINGKWILSPASKSKTVVIIDAETQKVHGKIANVNEGDLAVWVVDPNQRVSGSGSPKSFVAMIWFCILYRFLF